MSMPDVDVKTLFGSIEKLLRLQGEAHKRQADAERVRMEMRVRETEHARMVDQSQREIAATLNDIRKQLGLPDLSTPSSNESSSKFSSVEDVFNTFGDLFKDFFSPDRDRQTLP